MSRAVGWILDEAQRADLLVRFPPRFAKAIAHHVTLSGHKVGADIPPQAIIELIGQAANEKIECYAARVDGRTHRPDGNIYHVTWSLDPDSGATAKDSNSLLLTQGWTPLPEPVALMTRPDWI